MLIPLAKACIHLFSTPDLVKYQDRLGSKDLSGNLSRRRKSLNLKPGKRRLGDFCHAAHWIIEFVTSQMYVALRNNASIIALGQRLTNRGKKTRLNVTQLIPVPVVILFQTYIIHHNRP